MRTRPAVAGAVAVLVAALVAVLGWLLRPGGSDSGVLRAGNARALVGVELGRASIGPTTATITVTDHDGTPVTGLFVQAEAVMPSMGYATPETAATAAGNGRYTVAGIDLMTTGQWELHLRLDGGEELVLPFQVTG